MDSLIRRDGVSGQLKPATTGHFKTSQFEGQKLVSHRRLASERTQLELSTSYYQIAGEGLVASRHCS
jgi:hypothetical protein